jgi:hypothetical protein
MLHSASDSQLSLENKLELSSEKFAKCLSALESLNSVQNVFQQLHDQMLSQSAAILDAEKLLLEAKQRADEVKDGNHDTSLIGTLQKRYAFSSLPYPSSSHRRNLS